VTAARAAKIPAADFEALVESDNAPTVTAFAECSTVTVTASPPRNGKR
jgi:hypothetical protein